MYCGPPSLLPLEYTNKNMGAIEKGAPDGKRWEWSKCTFGGISSSGKDNRNMSKTVAYSRRVEQQQDIVMIASCMITVFLDIST